MSKAKPLSKAGKGRTKRLSPKKSNTASKIRSQSKTVSRKKKAASPSKPVKKKTSKPAKESILKTRLRYEQALAACAHELLVNPKSSKQPLQNSIKHLLQAAQVSRVYIFENFKDPEDGLCVRQIYETVAKGIKPEIDNPDMQHFPMVGAGFERWAKLLPQGKHVGGNVADFPKGQREIMQAQNIRSLLMLPIFVGQQWYGFIGFDDCVTPRDWSKDDIRMLRTASEIIGGYLSHKQMQGTLHETQARLEIQLKQQRANLNTTHADLSKEVVKRKRSVKALEESEEQFRQIAKSIDEIFWMTSPDGKKVLYITPAFERIFGIKVETLYRDPARWADVLHPEDRDRVLENWSEEKLIQGLYDIEYRIIRKDGTLRWISAKGFPVKNHKGEVYRIVGIASDITGKKKMEIQLMESEERFRQLAENIDEIFWMVSPGGEEVFYVSPVFERIFGIKAETVYKDPAAWMSVLHPDDRDRVLENFTEEKLTQGLYDIEYRIIRGDGTLRWISDKGFPVKNHKGEVYRIVGVASDITGKKEMENQLRESEERFRSLADQAADPIFVRDFEGKFLEVNPKACESLGYTREELLQMSITDIVINFDAKAIREKFKQLPPGETFTVEGIHRRKNGTTYPVEAHLGTILWKGQPCVLSNARDITRRKQVEQELRESEGRFRSLADQATDAFFVHDFEGKLMEVNPKACESLGYTREELLTMSVSDIEVKISPGDMLEGLHKMKPGESVTFEGMHRRRNGTTFPVEVHLGPILWEGKNYLFATVRDITQRKRVEQELLKTKEAAEKASMAKSEFLSRVSHELRTPLNAILGFGQLLESYSNQPLSKIQQTQVREILNAGHHLLELINDVLDLSHIESGNMALTIQAVPLKDLLEETLGLVETMAKDRGISIQCELSGHENLMVSGDPTRLKQVFLNLFTNAIKYNQENGSVRIAIGGLEEDSVQIIFEDNGLGIPSDKREIIFEPFHRLEAGPSPVEGTGMGLSIVKHLLNMMGGSIRVESGPEGGSRFVVGLTRIIETGDQTVQTKFFPKGSDVSSQKGQTYQILYIEDNSSNMRLVQQALKSRSHINLLSADHPRTGIILARNEQPDLILLDINLPEMDGFSVLKLLQGYEETRDIPVIAISAHAMQEDIDKALSLGFLKYISKPIEVDILLSHIDSALESNSP